MSKEQDKLLLIKPAIQMMQTQAVMKFLFTEKWILTSH